MEGTITITANGESIEITTSLRNVSLDDKMRILFAVESGLHMDEAQHLMFALARNHIKDRMPCREIDMSGLSGLMTKEDDEDVDQD